MNCFIFRSSKKDFTYIYLRDGYSFDDLPPDLRHVFGEPQLVTKLELSPERRLAKEDVLEVMKNLETQGFHLQLPPHEDVTGLLDLPNKEEKPL